MVNKGSFSYEEYLNIVRQLMSRLPLMDYAEVNEQTEKFLIIRHDVEFSVGRAYQLAVLEKEKLNITTSYFFQMRNDAYNIFSEQNIELIKKIRALGHKIGAHIYFEHNRPDNFADYLAKDIKVMEACLDLSIDRFSYHRPSPQILEQHIKIDGLINPYDQKYFTYYQGEKPAKLPVLYLAESNKTLNNRWPYGYPLDYDLPKVDKIQLLIHPYQWTSGGYEDNLDLFLSLIKERKLEMIQTMQRNCQSFAKLLEKIKKYDL
ncbi:MAG: hypothetical protein NTZ18_04965 [Candidatus Komeilibacteria bacterium]|nr:hypothetical protein [Candidatus Komeilibacteria bacterium]